MLILRVIAGRVVMSLQGQTQRVQGELTLTQAQKLRAELDDMIGILEAGHDQRNSLEDLIQMIGVAGVA